MSFMKKVKKLSCIPGFFLLFAFVPGSSHAEDKLELTLADAVNSALEQNLAIAEQNLLVDRAEADVLAGEGEFDPSLSFDLSRAYSRESTFTAIASAEEKTFDYGVSLGGKVRTGTAYELRYSESKVERSDTLFLETNPYYSADLMLTLSQPLLKGLGRPVQEARVRTSRKGLEAARLGAGLKAVEVIAETVAAYWDLHFAIGDREVAVDSLKLAQNLLEEVRTKIKTGALAPMEIYKAEAEVAIREERLLQARKAVSDAEDLLRALMNTEEWALEIVPVDSPPQPSAAPEQQEVLETAMENRRDYQQALREHEGRMVMSRYYRNQKLPELDLRASAGLSGLSGDRSEAVDDASSGDFYSWLVGLELSIPLGNRAAAGNYLKAKRDEDAAALKVEQIRRAIVIEAREALRALRLARESIQATGRTRVASYNRLKAEEERFRLGMATLNDVLGFQEEYAVALSSEKRAQTEYAKAEINIRKVSGTLLPFPGR